MKKYLIFTPPYSGHLHPNLALAIELKKHNRVAIVSTPSAEQSISAAGLRPIIALKSHENEVQSIGNPQKKVKNNPFLLIKQFRSNLQLMLEFQTEIKCILDTEQPDAVIVDFTLPTVGIYAETHGIPWFTTLASPCVFEGRSGPPGYMGGLYPYKGWLYKLRDLILRKLIRVFKNLTFFWFRKYFHTLGIPAVYYPNGNERCYSQRKVFALGMKELEFNRDCSENYLVVGPLLYTPPQMIDSPLFIKDKQHILITMGTHLNHAKQKLLKHLSEIIESMPNLIFHFSHGNSSIQLNVSNSSNLQQYNFISYCDHLHKYDAVIHHGGTGILYECIRNAVPAIVLPIDFDQFDNAARLQLAGGGLRIKSLKELQYTIPYILNNQIIKNRCLELQNAFHSYSAAKIISDYIVDNQ